MNVKQWQTQLAETIANTLDEFRSKHKQEMSVFAVDCHPWNGAFFLAFLTTQELKRDPSLADVREMASWDYYDFGSDLPSWEATDELGELMKFEYYKPDVVCAAVARQFMEYCAVVVSSKRVLDAIDSFHLAKNFRITIPHPDSDEEFYFGPYSQYA